MDLYNVGAHRGNHRSRLNPKLKKHVHKFDTNQLAVIDLSQTSETVDRISSLFYKLGTKKRQAFIVGTSKYIKDFTVEFAKSFTGDTMPYVDNRWLGGTVTNWPTVKKTLKSLEKVESIINNTEFFDKLSRNEQLSMTRECEKKQSLFGGLKFLRSNHPGVIIVLDAVRNYNAILEGQTAGVPVVIFGNVNTKLLPKNKDNIIVCNNTSVDTVRMISQVFVESYNDGLLVGAAAMATEKNEKAIKKVFVPR